MQRVCRQWQGETCGAGGA